MPIPSLPLDSIIWGDCLREMRRFPRDSVDLIFADPPYNLQLKQTLIRPNRTVVDAVDDRWDQFEDFRAYDRFTTAWLKECRRLLRPTGTIWVIGTYHNIYRLGAILQNLGFWVLNDVVWIKCLAATTYVYARIPSGERPSTLKDLVRLDPSTVQLWNGEKWTQVLGWRETVSAEAAVEIELRSGERLRCTSNHQWPTQRGLVATSDLQVGDVIQTCQLPEPDEPVQPFGLDDELVGWFVGLYIAEGSRTGDTIQIASHTREAARFERLKCLADAYHGTLAIHQTKENTCTANLNGPVLNGIIDTYVGGRTAKNKRLNARCWQRSNRFLLALLNGYLSGDGYYDARNDRWRLGFTSNLDLEADLRSLCARLGIGLRLRGGWARCAGKEFPTCRGEIRFTTRSHHSARADGEVVRIGTSWCTKFWDVAVADQPHLFALASGVLTKNSNPMPNFRGVRLTNAHETLIWAKKSESARGYTFNYHQLKQMNGGKQMRSDWYFPLCGGQERLRGDDGKKAHSTQKPEKLLERIILGCTKEGDVVLDPFAGTGTTPYVAQQYGRRWIAIEKEAEYVELMARRLGVPVKPERRGVIRRRRAA
jgi:DNA modification methylase